MPPSTSDRISAMTSRRYLSSVCSSSVTRAATTLTPASIIVASWREKTWRFFGCGVLQSGPRPARPARGALAQRVREQPAGLQLLARRREVGRMDLTAELEALRVDCVVGECGHLLVPRLSHRLRYPVACAK